MMNILSTKDIAYNAKERLLANIDDYIEANELGNVQAQMNASAARKGREYIQGLNRVAAYLTEKRIMEKESYDPSKDKWGFGPVTVSPVDYITFAKEVMNESEEV